MLIEYKTFQIDNMNFVRLAFKMIKKKLIVKEMAARG
jgi:hypothetical protein